MKAHRASAALLLCLLGACPRSVDGEQWATRRFGVTGAEGLRAMARQLLERNRVESEDDMPYAKRPLVVLEVVADDAGRERLRFHPVNAELPAEFHAARAEDVATLVILLPEEQAQAKGRSSLPGRTLLLGDLELHAYLTARIGMLDSGRLRAAIQALPADRPAVAGGRTARSVLLEAGRTRASTAPAEDSTASAAGSPAQGDSAAAADLPADDGTAAAASQPHAAQGTTAPPQE